MLITSRKGIMSIRSSDTANFISSTLELLAHAGIIHQLTIYFVFPKLSIAEYSMIYTGNRHRDNPWDVSWWNISPNYCFKFILLSKMNLTMHSAGYVL
jgi:hypothetical protein